MAIGIGIAGIVVSILLFVWLVYRGWSSYWVAPLCAILIAVTNQLNPVDAITNVFAHGVAEMFVSLFSVLFLGAILGKLFQDTGAASSIAFALKKAFLDKQTDPKRRVGMALLIFLIVGCLCSLGGIDGYVSTFMLFPIALILAEAANIPRRFIPAMLVLNTACMAAPGAPQIYNVMAVAAMSSTGNVVSNSAGALVGYIEVVVVEIGLFFILRKTVLNAHAKGESFSYGPLEDLRGSLVEERPLPPVIFAILPLLVVFVLYTLLNLSVFIALAAGIVLTLVLMFKWIPTEMREKGMSAPPIKLTRGQAVIRSLNIGANNYPGALLSVATPAGIAAVVMATSSFGAIVGAMHGLQIHPVVLTVILVCIIVALSSSPPATMMIAIPVIVSVATSSGMDFNPIAITRVAAIAATTFESLPINGMILLTTNIARSTHKLSYKPQFLMTVVMTLIGTILAAALFLLFPGLA